MDYKTNRAQKANRRFPYMTADEVDFLRSLVSTISPTATVVNIGAGAGVSALAIKETRRNAYLWTIDIRQEKSPLGSLAVEKALLLRYGYADSRYHQICSRSQDVVWRDGPIDLIFIDGGHAYHEVRDDILAWRPRMKKGGVMAFHDYDPGPEAVWPGVADAVDEMMAGCEPLGRVGNMVAFRVL